MENSSDLQNKPSTGTGNFSWLNMPAYSRVGADDVEMTTSPGTDFWQRTYYGFRSSNAPAFLIPVAGDFTFTVETSFSPLKLYDQCGLLLYADDENWVKASIEYENQHESHLGSVVTCRGYSDWAVSVVPSSSVRMFYRLSRRNDDFFLEKSEDGNIYSQMRIFHLELPAKTWQVGVYACSPLESSFLAFFSGFRLTGCTWPPFEKSLPESAS